MLGVSSKGGAGGVRMSPRRNDMLVAGRPTSPAVTVAAVEPAGSLGGAPELRLGRWGCGPETGGTDQRRSSGRRLALDRPFSVGKVRERTRSPAFMVYLYLVCSTAGQVVHQSRGGDSSEDNEGTREDDQRGAWVTRRARSSKQKRCAHLPVGQECVDGR